MSKLLQFLIENPVNDITEEVYISDRFLDENGNKIPFKIRAMTGEEFNEYQRQAIKIRRKNTEFDTKRYNELIVINHTLEPDFKNADAIKDAGCILPEQFLYKSLLAGEISRLAEEITNLSGFNTDMEQARDEAKN